MIVRELAAMLSNLDPEMLVLSPDNYYEAGGPIFVGLEVVTRDDRVLKRDGHPSTTVPRWRFLHCLEEATEMAAAGLVRVIPIRALVIR